MARFSALDTRLDPYLEADNIERVRRLVIGRRRLRHEAAAIDLSIIVLNKDRPDLLGALWVSFGEVRRIGASRGISVELLLGDTGSTDPEAVALLDSPPAGVRVIRDLTYQFSRNNNDLFESSRGSIILFMNNDVLIDRRPASLIEAYEHLAANVDLGILGAVLHFDDGSLQHAGMDFLRDPGVFGLPFHPGAHSHREIPDGLYLPVSAVTGAFLMIPADLFSSVGGFDEGYAKECQDVDLCLKVLRVGRRIEVGSLGHLVHLENATRTTGEEDWPDRALFLRRWGSFVETL